MFGQGDVDCGQFLALGLDGGWISSLLMGPAIQGLLQPHNLDSLVGSWGFDRLRSTEQQEHWGGGTRG